MKSESVQSSMESKLCVTMGCEREAKGGIAYCEEHAKVINGSGDREEVRPCFRMGCPHPAVRKIRRVMYCQTHADEQLQAMSESQKNSKRSKKGKAEVGTQSESQRQQVKNSNGDLPRIAQAAIRLEEARVAFDKALEELNVAAAELQEMVDDQTVVVA